MIQETGPNRPSLSIDDQNQLIKIKFERTTIALGKIARVAAANYYRDHGLCLSQGYQIEFFWPDTEIDPVELGQIQATIGQLCFACPVQVDCIENSLSQEVISGYMGGLSPDLKQRVQAWRQGSWSKDDQVGGGLDDKNEPAKTGNQRRLNSVEKRNRAKIKRHIAKHPDDNRRQIAQAAGLHPRTVSRHLKALGRPPLLEVKRRIATFASDNPNASQKEVAAKLNLSPNTVRENMRQLGLPIIRDQTRVKLANRKRILDYARANPKKTIKDIAAALKLNPGTVSDHLKAANYGDYRSGQQKKAANRDRIITFINDNPEASNHEIGSNVGLSRKTVAEHLKEIGWRRTHHSRLQGNRNKQAINDYLEKNPNASSQEISRALNLSSATVSRHRQALGKSPGHNKTSLGQNNRRRIKDYIRENPKATRNEIGVALNLGQSTVGKHLAKIGRNPRPQSSDEDPGPVEQATTNQKQ